ncbi:MAG: cytochrome P450, partial [Acidimicrobiia bacterium]
VARYQEVRRILHDPMFSADREQSTFVRRLREAGAMAVTLDPDYFGRTLLGLDPPDHTRLRRLVGAAFTPRRVEGLEPGVAEVTDGLLDALVGAGEVDLMASFAAPLPVLVISELLGLPAADRDLLKKWSDDVALLLDPFPSPEAVAAFSASLDEFHTYLTEQFEARRRQPRDDLISALVNARDGDDALTEAELFSMVVLLVAAGHETTTNLLGNAAVVLTRFPDQRDRLLAEPGLTASAVEELLRFESPVQRTSRVATRPAEVGGVEVSEGDLIFLLLAAANRDPEHFPDPDRLDLSRDNARDHLAFGHGIHHCLGSPLARLEGRVALSRLYRRFPRLEANLDQLTWRPSIILRGPERLSVRLG